MMKPLVVALCLLSLAGCASTPYRGNFEYFQLKTKHLVSRDLMVPVSVDNPDTPIHMVR